jgi:hypothetical protein
MRIHPRFAFFVLPFFFLLLPAPASALGPDFYLGYSRLGENTFNPNTPALNGVQGAVNFGFLPFIGAEADVAYYGLGASSNVSHSTTYLFGPRVTVGAAGVHVFAHGLFGGEHSTLPNLASTSPIVGNFFEENAFVVAAGGGLEIKVLPFFSWRVTGDYIQAPTRSNTSSHSRFGTGLVFRF